MVPYGIGLDLGQFQLSTTVKKVEVNKTIDPAIFAMPKARAQSGHNRRRYAVAFQHFGSISLRRLGPETSQGHDGQNQSAIRKGSAGCLDLGIVAQVVFGLMHRHF